MKILILANKFPYPAEDGSSKAIMSMLEGLASCAEVTLFALNTSKHYKPNPALPKSLKDRVQVVAPKIQTDITPFGMFQNLISGTPYHCSRFINNQTAEQVIALLKQTRFDIVQLETVYMGVYLPIIRAHSKAKVVLRAHNVEGTLWLRNAKQERHPLKKWYLHLQAKRLQVFEQQCVQGVDGVVAISNVDKEALQAMSPQISFLTIPYGIYPEQHQIVSGNASKIGFFGSLDWLPNYQGIAWFLEDVWPIIAQQHPLATLEIAGKPIPKDLQEYQNARVQFLGFVEDLEHFMHSLGVVIVPILSGSGIRIKMIEAMASGKPIVSTRVGAEGIPATPGVHFVEADLAADFANAVLLLLNNPTKAAEIGKNARLLAVEKMDNKILINSLLSFYKSL